MELTNEFVVTVPVEEAWAVLTDVERIAPCMPGAELQEVEGDEYRGIVKVKVGPITASYRGSARFEEKDAAVHRGVLKAEGRETRGQGNASAVITATLSPSGDGTKVEVVTDLAITGKVAQFGRGMLAEVSGKLLDQFVHNLETMVLAPALSADAKASPGEPKAAPGAKAVGAAKATRPSAGGKQKATPVAAAAEATAGGEGEVRAPEAAATSGDEPSKATVRQIESAPAEPVDLGRIAAPSLAKRLLPFASAAGVIFLIRVIVYALRRRNR